jgi:hypothetical protein
MFSEWLGRNSVRASTWRWVTTYDGDLDQEDDMSGTTTDQHAVTPSDEAKAVDRLLGQIADLSMVRGEAR